MSLQAEAEFFREINTAVRELAAGFKSRPDVAQYKTKGDYATELDVAVERLITTEIQKRFPGDHILAEEESTDTEITDERIWIIDPICGTANLGRGMRSFCTNIALAENKQVVASCVIDHSQDEYFWSIGEGKIYCNDQPLERPETPEDFGVVIDVDFGSVPFVDADRQQRHGAAVRRLVSQKGWSLQSLNSSLGFAYTAAGKIDGFINADNHPWDICAASFLIQQSGGIITDLDGKPWNIMSVGAIAAGAADVHQKLLEAYNN